MAYHKGEDGKFRDENGNLSPFSGGESKYPKEDIAPIPIKNNDQEYLPYDSEPTNGFAEITLLLTIILVLGACWWTINDGAKIDSPPIVSVPQQSYFPPQFIAQISPDKTEVKLPELPTLPPPVIQTQEYVQQQSEPMRLNPPATRYVGGRTVVDPTYEQAVYAYEHSSHDHAGNGDCYGRDNDGDGYIETVYVSAYTTEDGTYVPSQYRAAWGSHNYPPN